MVTSDKSPGVALSEQIGGSRTPAKGGRSLVVMKSHTALDTSTLGVGKMAFQYVSRGQASVTRCFEDLRAKDPSATGVLTLRFAVGVKGAVVDAHVDGFNREVASCVQSAMSTWTFSAPDKQTRFELVLDLVIG
ncbi:MAG: AgmX/PglI C-terminal domain-containing protein [Deltaproteobacteria bacterium]|nr:AgmX/PglI C-terminal domain-containing protein [Deltaproteobacteria bacterium]